MISDHAVSLTGNACGFADLHVRSAVSDAFAAELSPMAEAKSRGSQQLLDLLFLIPQVDENVLGEAERVLFREVDAAVLDNRL